MSWTASPPATKSASVAETWNSTRLSSAFCDSGCDWLRLRLRLGRQLGPDLLFLPAFAGLQVIDQPGLDDELTGLQGVDVILPVAPAADDAGKGKTAIELINHAFGDGQAPVEADRGSGRTRLDHDAVGIGPLGAGYDSVHGMTPARQRQGSSAPELDAWDRLSDPCG